MDDLYQKLQDRFPFLTAGKYLDTEYLGIVQNCDNSFLSMYCYDIIPNEEMRRYFLKCGEVWWWESNRQIPINVFLGQKFKPFQPYLRSFAKKEFAIIAGPTVSLADVIQKRIKRRQIQLVAKVPH